MSEHANAQQTPSGQPIPGTETSRTRRVVKSAINQATGIGCCAAFLFGVWALCAGSNLVVYEAAKGLVVGVILGAINGAWKALGWPEWAGSIVGLSTVGAVLAVLLGWRSGSNSGAVVGAIIFGAIAGAAMAGIAEMDLGVRIIRIVGKALRRRREDHSERPHTDSNNSSP